MDGFNNNNFDGYGQDPNAQAYTATPEPSTQSYTDPSMQTFTNASEPIKCPGKEIAGLILGINAIFWSGLGTLLGCIPVYGLIFACIWNAFGIGTGIAAMVLHKKVHEQATEISNKIETGKKLGLIGIIVGIAGIVIAIIVFIVLVVIIGVGAVGGAATSNGINFNP
ncbi:MAG: hypothetical protein IKN45_01830 [Lachnospiraceae bacterium]|nr:hypothetical protein [Lachnospiraceae bacterium]